MTHDSRDCAFSVKSWNRSRSSPVFLVISRHHAAFARQSPSNKLLLVPKALISWVLHTSALLRHCIIGYFVRYKEESRHEGGYEADLKSCRENLPLTHFGKLFQTTSTNSSAPFSQSSWLIFSAFWQPWASIAASIPRPSSCHNNRTNLHIKIGRRLITWVNTRLVDRLVSI